MKKVSEMDNYDLQMLAQDFGADGQAARDELARRAERQTPRDPHELIKPQESQQAFTRRKLDELHRLDKIKSLRKKYRKRG